MLSHHEYRQLQLAGTITFPATFPQVGRLDLRCIELPLKNCERREFIFVSESPSPRVTLTRRVYASGVRAVFLPRDPRHVNYGDGEWLVGPDVICSLKQRLSCGKAVYGIIFVPENEPSLLHVSAGMTAAENAQYYPPLPGDTSNNHYNPWPGKHSGSAGYWSCREDDQAPQPCDLDDCYGMPCDDLCAMPCDFVESYGMPCDEFGGYPLPCDENPDQMFPSDNA
jgi:hypothetical protein